MKYDVLLDEVVKLLDRYPDFVKEYGEEPESIYCLYNYVKTGSRSIMAEGVFNSSTSLKDRAKLNLSSLCGMSVTNEEKQKLEAAYKRGVNLKGGN